MHTEIFENYIQYRTISVSKVIFLQTAEFIGFNKYVIPKNQSYQNIAVIKVALPFLYSSLRKKLRRILSIFDIEK